MLESWGLQFRCSNSYRTPLVISYFHCQSPASPFLSKYIHERNNECTYLDADHASFDKRTPPLNGMSQAMFGAKSRWGKVLALQPIFESVDKSIMFGKDLSPEHMAIRKLILISFFRKETVFSECFAVHRNEKIQNVITPKKSIIPAWGVLRPSWISRAISEWKRHAEAAVKNKNLTLNHLREVTGRLHSKIIFLHECLQQNRALFSFDNFFCGCSFLEWSYMACTAIKAQCCILPYVEPHYLPFHVIQQVINSSGVIHGDFCANSFRSSEASYNPSIFLAFFCQLSVRCYVCPLADIAALLLEVLRAWVKALFQDRSRKHALSVSAFLELLPRNWIPAINIVFTFPYSFIVSVCLLVQVTW